MSRYSVPKKCHEKDSVICHEKKSCLKKKSHKTLHSNVCNKNVKKFIVCDEKRH